MRKLSAALLLLFTFYAHAQTSTVDERIHIHFDKAAYIAGDAIWFKAYLFAELRPSEISTNFFVDLLNESGQLVLQKKYPVFNGASVGAIVLPSNLKEGAYILRAYTPNILNNDPSFIYAKGLAVFNPSNRSASQIDQTQNTKIMEPLAEKMVFAIEVKSDAKRFEVISTNAPDNLSLSGYMYQYELFKTPLKFSNGKAKGSIPVAEFPSGILHLVISEGENEILHRQLLIDNKEYELAVQLKTDTLNLDKKGRNAFTVQFPIDTLAGTFSISVTDADKELTSTLSSIQSSLLIDENLSGFAIDSLPNAIVILQKRKGTPSKTKPVLNLSQEPQYLRLSGQVIDANISELKLQLQTKDSSSTWIEMPVGKDGHFERDNLVYYDTASFGFDAAMGNLKIEPDPIATDYSKYVSKTDYSWQIKEAYAVLNDPVARQKAKSLYTIRTDINTTTKTTSKKEQKPKNKNDVDARYTSGLFSGKNARSFDFITHPPTSGAQNVFEYLRGQMAGLRIEKSGGGYSLWSNRSPSTLEAIRGNSQGSVPAKVFLNEAETQSSQVASIPMSQIALVKYFAPGNIMLPGIGLSGVFAVYTKKPDDLGTETSFMYPGYSPVANFPQPDYSSGDKSMVDRRTTLYWEPNILIQPGMKSYSFSFYNSHEAKRFHVVVKGFTADGKLVYMDKVIEGPKMF